MTTTAWSDLHYNNFWRYCWASSPETICLTDPKGKDVLYNDSSMPRLSPGQLINLTGMCPNPGDRIPAVSLPQPPIPSGDVPALNLPECIIPSNVVFDFKWLIQVANFEPGKSEPSFPSTPTFATAGEDFQIISGALNSRQLVIDPRPRYSSDIPKGMSRAFLIWWQVGIWQTGRTTNKLFTIPMTVAVAAVRGPLGSTISPYVYPRLAHLQAVLTAADILEPPNDDLFAKFASLCSISSPDMKSISASGADSIINASDVNFSAPGTQVSLAAIYPPLDTVIPTGGLKIPGTNDAIKTPGGLPPASTIRFRWGIQAISFSPPKTKDEKIQLKVKDFVDIRPGTATNDLGGGFDIISGDLRLPQLSFVPWPDSVTITTDTTTNTTVSPRPSDRFRVFRVWLEIILSSPFRVELPYFTIPTPASTALYFGVDSWAKTFGDSSGTAPSIPPEVTTGKPDPLKFFRNMFTKSINTLSPSPGEAARLLLSPTNQTPSIPQQVKEIVHQKPDIKIQAALDLGAILENIVSGVTNVFGFTPEDHKVGSEALKVFDILSSIFSIPIAVDINGESITKTILPTSALPVPDLANTVSSPQSLFANLPGTSAITGVVPVGGLKTIVGAAAQELKGTASATGAKCKISNLRDGFGLNLLPVPKFVTLGDSITPTTEISITLPIYVLVPGAKVPFKIDLELGKFNIYVPLVPVPQIAMCMRQNVFEFIPTAEEAWNFQTLVCPDPLASKYLPNIDLIKSGLTTLATTLKKIFEAFDAATDAALLGNDTFTGWASLASTIDQMLKRIADGQNHFPPANNLQLAPSIAQEVDFRRGDWYGDSVVQYPPYDPRQDDPVPHVPTDNVRTFKNDNISVVYWIGCPNSWSGDPPPKYGMVLRLLAPSDSVQEVSFEEYLVFPSAWGWGKSIGNSSNVYAIVFAPDVELDVWYYRKVMHKPGFESKNVEESHRALAQNPVWNDRIHKLQWVTK